jgi:twinkle protein
MKSISHDIDFLKFTGVVERQFIQHTRDYIDAVKIRFENGPEIRGEKLPWKKTFEKVGLRLGEVSLWPGVNGHGKSLVLGQVLLWLPYSIKSLIASLEMQPAATIERMVRQASGSAHPSQEFIHEFAEATENIYIYDQMDTVEPNRILGMIHYAAQELEVKHFMIDSLVKCGIAPDDYNRQTEFVDRLCWAAKTENIHIHLVHHARKGSKEGDELDKFDIKGSGSITDLVDNIFIVHRNKNKEAKIELGKEYDYMEPDGYIKVNKQRHGEWEGKINLYFHKESQQYVSGPDSAPLLWRFSTNQTR